MHVNRALGVVIMCSGFGASLAAQDARQSFQQLSGAWEGTIGTSNATPIRFSFANDSTQMRGEFDALASGVLAMPVRVSTDTGGVFRLTIPNGWVFRARLAGREMSGMLSANGKSAPFVLHRTDNVQRPYSLEAVEFRNGGTTLSGTLFIPQGKRSMPAVVVAHGSGPMDRTADNFLGDHLARRGIVVLLYDKRGVGQSTGEWRGARLDDLAADAVSGVRLLRTRSDVDTSRIGVAGRSQGGQLAIISASRYPDVAFAVNISGSVIPPWKQMNYEAAATMTRDKLSRDDSVAAQAFMNEKWSVARTGLGWDSLAAHVQRIRAAKPAWLGYMQVPDKLSDIRDSWDGQMGYDFGSVLSSLTKPVLALFGELDTSTPAMETVAALRAGLVESRNSRVIIQVYPNADHALLIWNYQASEIEFPRFPPGYPDIVARWIQELK